MLLADASESTWIGVAIAVIALVGTIANGVVGYFKDRDKLVYDRKVNDLENDVKQCKDQHEEAKAKLESCEKAHEESSARHDEHELRLRALEETKRQS